MSLPTSAATSFARGTGGRLGRRRHRAPDDAERRHRAGQRHRDRHLWPYGVCDFDADGVDDLFLATRAGFWFSSFGEFPWSYLGPQKDKLENLRLGYFDDDKRCDVLAEDRGNWVISSGGTGRWHSIGSFGASLAELPSAGSTRMCGSPPGVTRRTTHAFLRGSDGQWLITSLAQPDWQPVGSSSKPMRELRFGDFTGDGVTDVLAVVSGRWAISKARAPWRNLNRRHGDAVKSLHIADLNNNNIDDRSGWRRSVAQAQVTGRKAHVVGVGRWARKVAPAEDLLFSGGICRPASAYLWACRPLRAKRPAAACWSATSSGQATSSAKRRSRPAPRPTGPPSARFIIECGSTRIFAGDPRPGWMTLLLGKAVRLGTVVRMSSRSGASTGVIHTALLALRARLNRGPSEVAGSLAPKAIDLSWFPYVVIGLA